MKDLVCSHCGGRITNRKIWGEDFERSVCNNCQRVEYGVPKDIYKITNDYVRKNNYHYYSPYTWEGHVVSNDEEDLSIEENVSHLSFVFWSLLTEYNKI